jgi:protein gp37
VSEGMEPLWWLTKDGDPLGMELARRHYSAWKNREPKIRQFVGPGQKLVLRTGDGDALWAWRKFIDDSGQKGVCCTIFRNEGPLESSELVRQACRIADAIWPDQRRYTFIDPSKVASKNPGYCFKLAGWKLVRDAHGRPVKTKKGFLNLELFPEGGEMKGDVGLWCIAARRVDEEAEWQSQIAALRGLPIIERLRGLKQTTAWKHWDYVIPFPHRATGAGKREEMKDSKIEWTHHTFNPWWGCTKVSAGCAHCYAETLSKRTGHRIWGDDAERRFFGDKHWAEPLKWNKSAEALGERHRVFCASMADVFEKRPELIEQRKRLGELIKATRWLDYLLLTKRPENAPAMLREMGLDESDNYWVGTSCENQPTANERIPHLLKCPAAVLFISAEPLLGALNIKPYLSNNYMTRCPGSEAASMGIINWVITGDESGPDRRETKVEWTRDIKNQCGQAGVAYFNKQMFINGKMRHDLLEFPVDLRIRQFPKPQLLHKD